MLRAGGWQSEEIASLGPISTPGPIVASEPVAKPVVATVAEDAEPHRGSSGHNSDPESLDTNTRFFSREAARPSQSDYVPPSKSGSIVRLDKALGQTSYEQPKPEPKVTTQVASMPAPAADHTEVQSRTEPAFATTIPMVDATSNKYSRHQANAEVRQVERELRRAKVRVFNPIWEVDQLQWPDVCVKLMNARMDSLNYVTKHLFEACQEGLQVLAVTSPEGGEGRTTVACCLAMLAGSRGLKVAIVDGDIENPTLSLQTNLEIENDWQSAIMNQMPLEEVSVHSIDDQITLIPLLGPLDQSELPKSDQRIADMLIELSESFDLVVLDIGHMSSPNGLMNSLAEQGIINAAIAVVDNRNSSTQGIETCIRRIRQAGVTSIGLVENFAA
jgi:Mrp family chromosome partitioning ATPase